MSSHLATVCVCGVIGCSAAVMASPLWALGSGVLGVILLISILVDA